MEVDLTLVFEQTKNDDKNNFLNVKNFYFYWLIYLIYTDDWLPILGCIKGSVKDDFFNINLRRNW